MAAQVFWAVFYSSRRPSQIGPTADFDGAAIPHPIFSMSRMILQRQKKPIVEADVDLHTMSSSIIFTDIIVL